MTADRERWILAQREREIAYQQREDDIMAGCTCPEGFITSDCRLHGVHR